MAAVDIDAAFETLVARERESLAQITAQLAPARPALKALASTPFFPAFSAALAARQEFLVQVSSWVEYAVDANVLTAIADRIGVVMDALEAFLPTLGDAVRDAYDLAGRDAGFLAAANAAGGLNGFVAKLVLPIDGLFAQLDFLYSGSQFAPDNTLALAAFQQVQVRGSLARGLRARGMGRGRGKGRPPGEGRRDMRR